MQSELKQLKPFGSLSEEAFVAALKTADMLVRMLDRHLADHGLSHQQYNVLRILRGAGAEGIPTLAIAERLIECAPGMTRLLDRLEEKEMVRRERCRVDRRQVLCHLTPKGEELLDRLEPVIRPLVEASFDRVTPDELENYVETMERIREQAEGL